ncbi:hypothetical protein POUND7_008615 [Theobroma cacao]
MEGKMELESEDRLSNLPVDGKRKREIESEDRLSNLPVEGKQKREVESEDRLSNLPVERKRKREIEIEDRLSNLPVERKQKMEIESADRLSNLPEAVLLHIISFLNTKDAVRTSILSTNWTNVWKDLKSMHLQGFTIKKENFDPKIFTSCPRLQSLKLNDILLEDGIVMFRIASITLKSLELSFLDKVRNQLIQFELLLTTATFVVAIFGVMGAKLTTTTGLSGIGAIMLTCFARNRTVGVCLGSGGEA